MKLIRYILLWLIFPLSLNANALTFATGKYLGEPLVIQSEGHYFAGAYVELVGALAKELKLDIGFMEVPRFRLYKAISKNFIQGSCFASPSWADETLGIIWSKPYMKSRSIFTVLKNSKLKRDDIYTTRGLRVGVIESYRYFGKIGAMFKEGKATRVDSVDILGSLRKLKEGEVDVILHHEFATVHNIRKTNLAGHVRTIDEANEIYPVHCALSKNSGISKSDLDGAVDRLKQSGQVEKIFSDYKVSSLVNKLN